MRKPVVDKKYCDFYCPYIGFNSKCVAYDVQLEMRDKKYRRTQDCIEEHGYQCGAIAAGPGHDALMTYFGLSYASFLTVPRVLLHEMPDDWQWKLAKLMEEYDETWDFSGIELTGTRVQCTRDGKLVKTPSWLINYRHPERDTIEELKAKGR